MSTHDYSYNDAGNPLNVTPNASANYYNVGLQKDIDYGYDTLHRLTSATYNTDSESEAFDYDLLGNRDAFTPRTGSALNYLHNDANEYTNIDTATPPVTAVLHDPAGNLISDESGYGYDYDNQNRLTLVFDDANADGVWDDGVEDKLAEYVYDALGRRIEYKDHVNGPSTRTTRYYHDGQNAIAEFDDSTTPVLQRYYVHGTTYVDERAIMHEAAISQDRYYFLRDLYTIDGLVNSRGHELERYTYDAYGKPVITVIKIHDVNANGMVNSTDANLVTTNTGLAPCTVGPILDIDGNGTIAQADVDLVTANFGPAGSTAPRSALRNPYLFTGRILDILHDASQSIHIALQDNRNRTYDHVHGRWLQREPWTYADGLNLYQYVQSRPSRWVDARGLQAQDSDIPEAGAPARPGQWRNKPDPDMNTPGSLKVVPNYKGPKDCCKTSKTKPTGKPNNCFLIAGAAQSDVGHASVGLEGLVPGIPATTVGLAAGSKYLYDDYVTSATNKDQGAVYECCCLTDKELNDLRVRFQEILRTGGTTGNFQDNSTPWRGITVSRQHWG